MGRGLGTLRAGSRFKRKAWACGENRREGSPCVRSDSQERPSRGLAPGHTGSKLHMLVPLSPPVNI